MVDGTLGSAGHAEAILQRLGPQGRLIGIDQDAEAIERCRVRIGQDPRVTLVHQNFRRMADVIGDLRVGPVDAVLLDLGISSEQLSDGTRGFSFQTKGELDMRMNPEVGLRASELLRRSSEEQLAALFYEYGEERHARRFARTIVTARRYQLIQTTEDLTSVLDQALPISQRYAKGKRPVWARRHPATRVFQALRIAVNDELGALREGLSAAWNCLRSGGRLAVISFHSLEDRIVKHQFRKWHDEKSVKLIFRKPIVAKRDEMLNNPRSRSAKLRVIKRIS